ncbi:hypothetical protein NLJ89_g9906 [Agrocybe chaxingu]|uniref:Uncharacterized protein n=1 Tax=Agrocybe chaxingu TaxID=84603 RepID=A0A9W8MT41_9AGAR|nr:hypothetical protein NLJ89_g9906 [Agrocybe chaxingu]
MASTSGSSSRSSPPKVFERKVEAIGAAHPNVRSITTSTAPVQNTDDGAQNRDVTLGNPLPLPMLLPLRRRSSPAPVSAATPALAPPPAPTPKQETQVPPTEAAKADALVSEEQHKEAMEVVLKKALEDQIAAKSALTQAKEEIRRQAEGIKEMQQILEATKKEKNQLKSELDLKRTECEEWKTKADKFERLAKKYSYDAGKLLKGFASEMGLTSEDTKPN